MFDGFVTDCFEIVCWTPSWKLPNKAETCRRFTTCLSLYLIVPFVYVCMYVCMYVCVCVCVYIYIYIYGDCFHLFIPLHGPSNQVAELSRKRNVCMYQCLHMLAGITQRGRCSYLLPDAVLSGGTAVPMKVTICRHWQLLSMLACLVSITYQTWVCNPSHCSLLVVRCPDAVGI